MKVVTIGGGWAYELMYKQHGFEIVTSVEEADIVQFTGGEDVDPSFYGEQKHVRTYYNNARDVEEKWLYERAVAQGKAIIGICRGSQFLNVMNGGSLYQDVNNHAIGGTHEMDCKVTGMTVPVSSTHHQMMRAGTTGEVIGTASLADRKEYFPEGATQPVVLEGFVEKDTEVVVYRGTRTLCYQPHPEMMRKDHPCQVHFMTLVAMLVEDEL